MYGGMVCAVQWAGPDGLGKRGHPPPWTLHPGSGCAHTGIRGRIPSGVVGGEVSPVACVCLRGGVGGTFCNSFAHWAGVGGHLLTFTLRRPR